jgi:hypothetical protein
MRENNTKMKDYLAQYSDQWLKEHINSVSVVTKKVSIFYGKTDTTDNKFLRNPFYDPSLFDKHPLIPKNNTIVPEICIALLSCKRVHYLRRTLRAIILYFSKVEPDITYEIAVLDNNSGHQVVREILNDYPVDIVILRRQNVGIAEGLDVLFHGACRSPFILSLEEDWEARVTTWPRTIPVMAMSMHVLMTDPLVLEIWLRDWANGLPDHRNRTGWLLAPANPNLLDGQPVMYRRLSRTPQSAWGGYTNGASLKHRDRLLSVGYMKVHEKNKIVDSDAEYPYAIRVSKAGYTSAHLCLPMWQRNMKCDLVPAKSEPYDMIGLFAHIGREGRSPGHGDFPQVSIVTG